MEEHNDHPIPQEPERPAQPPRPQWAPPILPPPPVYKTGKKELLFGLPLLILSVLLWNFIYAGGFSLGFALGAVGVMACSAAYLLCCGYKLTWYSGSILALCAVMAAGFARSDDGFVKYVLVHFLLVGVNLALCLMAGRNRWSPNGVSSLMDAPWTLFERGFGGMGATGRGLGEARKQAGKFGKQGIAVIVGLAVAVPVVAVLVVLLMSADAAFEGLLDLLPEMNIRELIFSLLFGCGFCYLLFSRNVSLHRGRKAEPARSRFRGIHIFTIYTILIAVCLVYLAYLVSQLAYLSGGFAGILPEEYTMAEYARRGFFEMCWLCAINLGIIAGANGLLGREKKATWLVKTLCLFIGLVTVFLVSAASAKMLFYIGGYGLTRLRVLTEVIMVFVGLTTVVVCVWLFMPKLPYMKIVLLLAFVMGAGVIWVDVDTQVAKYNVESYQSGKLETVDVYHLTGLGPGAIPHIRKLENDPNPDVAGPVRDHLEDVSYEIGDFRGWNLSKARGAAAVDAYRAEVMAEITDHLTQVLGVTVPGGTLEMRYESGIRAPLGQNAVALRFEEETAEAFRADLEKAGWQKRPMPLGELPGEKADWEFLDTWLLHPLEKMDEGCWLSREADGGYLVAAYDSAAGILYVFEKE